MSAALQAITEFYGDRRAQRSQVLLISHIVEGLTVLREVGTTQAAKDAYCLHPLFQADADLVANMTRAGEFSPHVMMLVMEYRARANAALSDRVTLHRAGHPQWNGALATPGPLKEVRQMLIADKVQNYADFLTYHAHTHSRSKELDFYFKHWLAQLDVSRDLYSLLVDRMRV